MDSFTSSRGEESKGLTAGETSVPPRAISSSQSSRGARGLRARAAPLAAHTIAVVRSKSLCTLGVVMSKFTKAVLFAFLVSFAVICPLTAGDGVVGKVKDAVGDSKKAFALGFIFQVKAGDTDKF